MLRAFKYRLYPNKRTEKKLLETLEICRLVYNKILETKKTVYETDKKSLSKFACNDLIAKWKEDDLILSGVHSQVLQNVSDRISKAFDGFFRRVKAGEKEVGYPRFKSYGRYDSFTFPQSGFEIKADKRKNVLRLSKIGDVRIVYHRQIEGVVKTCNIRKSSSGKWYATFSCELPDVEIKQIVENPIGVDRGLNQLVALSNGDSVSAPRFYRKSEQDLDRLNQKLSACGKGTPERKEAKKRLSLLHEKIANKRSDFNHHVSKQLARNFDFITFEDLSVSQMAKNHRFAKSIYDAAWTQLVQYTTYKAVEAGGGVVLVDPRYTSQICSSCGVKEKKTLNERWHECDCGLSIDRDHNAAINILRLGLQSLEAPNFSCGE